MRPRTRRRLIFLAGFALYFGAITYFWDTLFVYPLKIFVVLLHEVGHGAAALLTGGRIERIVLDPRQGGACYCPGGNAFLTLSAGYLGSALWGALFVVSARSRRIPPRRVTAAVGLSVLGLVFAVLHGAFTVAFGVAAGLALLVAAWKLPEGPNRGILSVLGLTSCLYAILDIRSDVLERPHLPSDAAMLAELTGIPTTLWGLLWIGGALGITVWLLRWSWVRT